MSDSLQTIDDAIKSWLDTYAVQVTDEQGNVAKVWWVTARRDMASLFATASDADVRQNDLLRERLVLPRISVMRATVAPDPQRQRPTTVRVPLGYINEGKAALYTAAYPVPVNIEYQVDFWTEKISAMNIWEIAFLRDFQTQLHYLTITVDELFRNKWVGLVGEAGLEDNSDLEPGEDKPNYRKTARFTAQTWLFPTAALVRKDATVRELVINLYSQTEDSALQTLIQSSQIF
jgi:hypothetical protein